MAATAHNKKKGTNTRKAPPKKKQKNELFSSNKKDLSDHSDNSDEEEVKEYEELDRDEEDSGSGSDNSSEGDDPLAHDFLQGSDDEAGGGSSSKGSMRVWTRDEEEALLTILEDVGARGQSATINMIGRQLAEMCPGSGLRANPDIGSKLKNWKKQYSLVYDMINKSGFEWNDTLKCVEVDSDEVWRSCVQSNKNAQGWIGKSFPTYDRLAIIFGKNLASGVGARTPIDMVDDLDQEVEAEFIGVDDIPCPISVNQTIHSESTTESHSRRRRKSKAKDNNLAQEFYNATSSLVNQMVEQMKQSSSLFNQIAERFEQAESNYPKYLAAELDRLGFSLDDNLAISKAMRMDASNVEIFKIIKTDAQKIEFAMKFMNEQ